MLDNNENLLKTLQIMYESKTLTDIIELKINNAKKKLELSETELAVAKEKLKRLNEDFKNENYDAMTKMKYRRFRADYQNKRNSILSNKRRELNNLEIKYNNDLNRLNLILDDMTRNNQKSNLKSKYFGNKNAINIKYDKIIQDFNYDYRYRTAQVGLKWRYIINDDMVI